MYEIMLGGQSVGKVNVDRIGLYYHFDCRCDFTGEVMYRIEVSCGEKAEILGIPVPENGKFILRTKLPVKKLGDGKLAFRALPKHGAMAGKFVPLAPEEPFRYLKRLQEAVLQVRDGKVGVILPPDTL